LKLTKSFENENMISENTFQVFMNDVMEEKSLQGCEINPNLQTKNKQNLRSRKKQMKENVRNCMLKK